MAGAPGTAHPTRDRRRPLFLSVNTVKAYNKSLYRKLGVSSRQEAVVAGPAARAHLNPPGCTRRAGGAPPPSPRSLWWCATTSGQLVINGPVADAVVEAIAARFGPSTVDRGVVTVEGVDQAAVRALMVLLWDTGHEVVAMSVR